MLVAFSGSHQQALSPSFAAHYSFAADHILLLRPTRKRDTAKTLKPVKRYEHLTGDLRIIESKTGNPASPPHRIT